MQNLLDDLKELFQQDDRLMVENSLLKSRIIELALKLDGDLIKLLLSHPRLRQHFFVEVAGVVVFDKEKFLQFVSNKAFLPDSYTAFSNKIGLTDDGGRTYLSRHGDVVLAWPYKDCVLEGGQTKEDAKRDEVFWNMTLAPDDIDRLLDPKVLTNFRRIDAGGEHTATEIADSDNLIIKGNNLLALHSLLPRFRGRVKLIYIDPPYNTGSDSFGYNDHFNHSTWLTFMRNRLEAARELLRKDGVIWISIDDNEVHYLKVLADEIFGSSNFMTFFYIQVRYANKTLVEDMDYQKLIETILVYRKSEKGRLIKEEVDYTIDKFVWTVIEKAKPQKIVELGGKRVEIFRQGQYEIVGGEPSYDKLKEIWASGKILDGNSSGRFFRDYLMGRYNADGYGVLYKVDGIGDDQFDYRYFTGPKREGATKGKYYQ
ncbi:MAG: site-specific DNA-methyltransferase, partial [Anaerolineae bacterium]